MPRLRFSTLLAEACIVPDARYHRWYVQHRNLIRFDALSSLESMLFWKLNKQNEDVKSASVHNSYTDFHKRLKRKAGSPAWARTTIQLTYTESITYRF